MDGYLAFVGERIVFLFRVHSGLKIFNKVRGLSLREEDKIKIAKRGRMKINVHIRDEMFPVHCGSGAQKLRWLSDVAIHRYDHFFGIDTGVWLMIGIGVAKGMRLENGVTLNM